MQHSTAMLLFGAPRKDKTMKNETPTTTIEEKPIKHQKFWENLQLLFLGMTIFGQVTIGLSFLLGQGVWLIANIGALIRDFALHRPAADKVKNAALTAITAGLIIGSFLL